MELRNKLLGLFTSFRQILELFEQFRIFEHLNVNFQFYGTLKQFVPDGKHEPFEHFRQVYTKNF